MTNKSAEELTRSAETEAQDTLANAYAVAEKLRTSTEAEVAALTQNAQISADQTIAAASREAERIRMSATTEATTLRSQVAHELEELRMKEEAELATLRTETEEEVARLKAETQREIMRIQTEADEQVAALRAEAGREIAEAARLRRASREAEAREYAEDGGGCSPRRQRPTAPSPKPSIAPSRATSQENHPICSIPPGKSRRILALARRTHACAPKHRTIPRRNGGEAHLAERVPANTLSSSDCVPSLNSEVGSPSALVGAAVVTPRRLTRTRTRR